MTFQKDRRGRVRVQVLIAFVFLLFISGCGNDPSGYMYHDQNVKGPVKSITQRTYGAAKDSLTWHTKELFGKKTFSFDKSGRLISKKVYGADTSLIERYEYEYRGSRRIKERRFDKSNTLTHVKKFSYPWMSGNVEAQVYSPTDSLLWKVSYHFDKKGREIKKEVYGRGGQLNYMLNYRYNPKNLIIQKTGVDKRTYHFTSFDNHGNWLRRINTVDRIKTSITKREIRYYAE